MQWSRLQKYNQLSSIRQYCLPLNSLHHDFPHDLHQKRTPKSSNWNQWSGPDLWWPCYFRVPLTCYTCVTALLWGRCTCCSLCDDWGTRSLWANMLVSVGRNGRESKSFEKQEYCLWPADLYRFKRRSESEGGAWLDAAELRWCQLAHSDHLWQRVWDLLWWVWALRGPRDRARLVLWYWTETHLLPLRHRGPLPRTHGDPFGHESHRSQGESCPSSG